MPSLAVAYFADQLQVPIKMHMTLNTNMDMIGTRCALLTIPGKRHPFLAQYKVGVNSANKLQAIQINFYSDGGAFFDTSNGVIQAALFAMDNTYYCPNTSYTGTLCRTNFPPNTAYVKK